MAEHRLLDPAARLRQARESKGLSHRQVADATKLSVRAIELLENDCLSGLPQGIYRRSIVRAVAREVGLNPEQLLNEFTTLHPDQLPSLPAAAVVEPRTASSSRLVTLMGAILPLVAGAAYLALPYARTVVADPARKAASAPQAVDRRHLDAARAAVLPIGGFAETAAAPDRPVPVIVTLTISSRCRLRIVADGNQIMERTVEQGETLPIELGEELVLEGDNASAVQFSINGQAGRLLGEPGAPLATRIGRDDYQDFLVRY